MNLSPNLRIFVTGKTQSGKSHWTKKMLLNYQNRFIYDLKREYSDFGVVVNSIGRLNDVINSRCTKIVYQPVNLHYDHFNEVCEVVFRRLKNILFCIDEAHNFCTKSFIPLEFKRIITVGQGEPYNIGVIAVTQRPANVHNDILCNASVIVVFKLNLINDAEAIEKLTGIPALDLQNLPYRCFYVYNDRDEQNSTHKYKPI